MPSNECITFDELQSQVEAGLMTAKEKVYHLQEGIARFEQEFHLDLDPNVESPRRPFCRRLQRAIAELRQETGDISWRIGRAQLLLREAVITRSKQKLAAACHTLNCGW